MLNARDLLMGILFPLLIAAALVPAGNWKKKAFGGPLGVGAGFLVGCASLFGVVRVPPPNVFDWIVIVAATIMVVATIADLFQASDRIRRTIGLIAFTAMTWLLLRSQTGWLCWAGLSALGWLWSMAWDELLRRAPAPWAGLVMLGLAGCGSLVLMLSDSQRFGQMGLALTAAATGTWIVGWTIKTQIWRASAMVWSVALYGLLLDGKFWGPAGGGLTWLNGGLLLIAPLMAWIGNAPGIKKMQGWKLAAIRIFAVILPATAAVILAIIEFQRAQQSGGSEYY